MYVFDVWSGPASQDHVARKIFDDDNYAALASRQKRELEAGNLVNVRKELAWGHDGEFDLREDNT